MTKSNLGKKWCISLKVSYNSSSSKAVGQELDQASNTEAEANAEAIERAAY